MRVEYRVMFRYCLAMTYIRQHSTVLLSFSYIAILLSFIFDKFMNIITSFARNRQFVYDIMPTAIVPLSAV